MNAAKGPGTAQEGRALRGCICGNEPFAPAPRTDFLLECSTNGVEHARNGYQCGGAVAFDGAQNFLRLLRVFENKGRTEKRRNEKTHELAKNVAERNERNESQRMEPTLVAAVFFDSLFERFEVSEK